MKAAGHQSGGVAPSRRLVVHLGLHKTGSTAIQRHLNRNADQLAGRLVLRTPQEGSPMRPLGRAALAYSLAPGKDSEAALRDALAEVLAGLPANGLPVLLSHENLAGAMPGKGGETGLYPVLPQIVRLIREGAAGFDLAFVYYTRDMAAWRPSVWSQLVRTEGYRRDLSAFEAEIAGLPGWDDLDRRLAHAAGDARLTRFRLEDEAALDRPGRQLLTLAGLDQAEIDALQVLEGPSNERLCDAATEFMRRLNGLAIHPHARRAVSDLVGRAQHLFAADTPSEGTL